MLESRTEMFVYHEIMPWVIRITFSAMAFILSLYVLGALNGSKDG